MVSVTSNLIRMLSAGRSDNPSRQMRMIVLAQSLDKLALPLRDLRVEYRLIGQHSGADDDLRVADVIQVKIISSGTIKAC